MRPRRPEKSVRPAAPKLRFSDRQIFLIILGVHLLLSVLLFDPKLSVGGDNANYLILAKSLLQGKYQDLFAPGSPPQSQYPPLFPLMMAPVVAVFGNSYIPPKLLVMLLALGAVWMLYLVLRRLTTGRDWIMPLALFSFCPLFFDYAHDLYTEVPFIFLSLVSVYFTLRSLGTKAEIRTARCEMPPKDSRALLWAGLAGAFAAGAFLTRAMGVTLMLALVITFVLRRRWGELGVAVAVFVLLWLPWLLRDMRVPHTGGYREQLFSKNMYAPSEGNVTVTDMIRRIFENLGIYVLSTYTVVILPLLQNAGKGIQGVIGVILTSLSLTGFVARIREKGFGLLEWYLLLSVGLLMFWPSVWSGDRFLLPVLPIMLWFLFAGLRWLGPRMGFKSLALFSTALIVLLFGVVDAQRAQTAITNLSAYVRGDKFAGYDDGWRTYFEAGLWLRDHTEPNAVVISRKPQFTYLMSGRQSFVYPYDTSQARVLKVIDSLGATHAYLETFFGQSMKYLYPVIRSHPDRFDQIGVLGPRDLQLAVFRINPPGAQSAIPATPVPGTAAPIPASR